MGFYLSEVARSEYVEAGNGAEEAAKKLRAHNEAIQIIFKQLLATVEGSSAAYPDDAFMEVLSELATMEGLLPSLQWALRKAVASLTTHEAAD
jgi:hypothetical protein